MKTSEFPDGDRREQHLIMTPEEVADTTETSTDLGERLQEVGLDAERAARLRSLAHETSQLIDDNDEVLRIMMEFLAANRKIASFEKEAAEEAADNEPDPLSVREVGEETDFETDQEKELSPEHLVRVAPAFALEMWADSWGNRGGETKTSKGIRDVVLNPHTSNSARRQMYGFTSDYMDFASMLERSGIAREWLDYEILKPGEGVVLQLDEENGQPTTESEKDKSDSTFILAFRSKYPDNAEGRRDDTSFICTLPHEEAESVRKNPYLLAKMIPHLADGGMPEKNKSVAKDLVIKEVLDLKPEHLPMVAEKIGRTRESYWRPPSEAAIDQAIRGHIARDDRRG